MKYKNPKLHCVDSSNKQAWCTSNGTGATAVNGACLNCATGSGVGAGGYTCGTGVEKNTTLNYSGQCASGKGDGTDVRTVYCCGAGTGVSPTSSTFTRHWSNCSQGPGAPQ
ncbi:MAG: hypothetical protein GY756_22675 [bacterium]|nr:hypothetical protein [bacterium]